MPAVIIWERTTTSCIWGVSDPICSCRGNIPFYTGNVFSLGSVG